MDLKKLTSCFLLEIKHQEFAFSVPALLTNLKIIGKLYVETNASSTSLKLIEQEG